MGIVKNNPKNESLPEEPPKMRGIYYVVYQRSANRLHTDKDRRKSVRLSIHIFFIPIWITYIV